MAVRYDHTTNPRAWEAYDTFERTGEMPDDVRYDATVRQALYDMAKAGGDTRVTQHPMLWAERHSDNMDAISVQISRAAEQMLSAMTPFAEAFNAMVAPPETRRERALAFYSRHVVWFMFVIVCVLPLLAIGVIALTR